MIASFEPLQFTHLYEEYHLQLDNRGKKNIHKQKDLTYSSLKSLLEEEKQKILHRLETIVQSPTMVALDAYKNRIQSKNHQIA